MCERARQERSVPRTGFKVNGKGSLTCGRSASMLGISAAAFCVVVQRMLSLLGSFVWSVEVAVESQGSLLLSDGINCQRVFITMHSITCHTQY